MFALWVWRYVEGGVCYRRGGAKRKTLNIPHEEGPFQPPNRLFSYKSLVILKVRKGNDTCASILIINLFTFIQLPNLRMLDKEFMCYYHNE